MADGGNGARPRGSHSVATRPFRILVAVTAEGARHGAGSQAAAAPAMTNALLACARVSTRDHLIQLPKVPCARSVHREFRRSNSERTSDVPAVEHVH